MKISACSFVNNGPTLGYPFIESILSALELVDEFVVAVGPSNDGTREAIESIDDPRVRIIDTTWAPNAPRGFVYSQQTMLALYNCTGDWALSLQGDEAIHERDCDGLRVLVTAAHNQSNVDGIALNYHHFYGRPELIAAGPKWYRAEARLVRLAGRKVIVPSDAQYLVNVSGRRRLSPLRAVRSNAFVYHYGWVRNRDSHDKKVTSTAQYWQEHRGTAMPYEQIDPHTLTDFDGTHPAAMAPWLESSANRSFERDPDYVLTRRDHKQRFKAMIERLTRLELSCTHFRPVRLRHEM
jgi:glycosyltransferase involved in cell wall biosynthesis